MDRILRPRRVPARIHCGHEAEHDGLAGGPRGAVLGGGGESRESRCWAGWGQVIWERSCRRIALIMV